MIPALLREAVGPAGCLLMTESEQPSVPLSTLLADPALGLRRIAGPAGEHRVRVSTVGTTEIEGPTPYLVGGELLLTAGVRLPLDAEGIDTYVRQVVAAGVSALGFGVAPVHEEVQPEMIAACDRHGLPLLRLPPATPFVAVGQAAYAAIAEAAEVPSVVHTEDPLAVHGLVPAADARDLARTCFAHSTGPARRAPRSSSTPCELDLPSKAVGTARPQPSRSTATPCATAWHGSANSSTSTCRTRAYAWNSGSPCAGCPTGRPRPTIGADEAVQAAQRRGTTTHLPYFA